MPKKMKTMKKTKTMPDSVKAPASKGKASKIARKSAKLSKKASAKTGMNAIGSMSDMKKDTKMGQKTMESMGFKK